MKNVIKYWRIIIFNQTTSAAGLGRFARHYTRCLLHNVSQERKLADGGILGPDTEHWWQQTFYATTVTMEWHLQFTQHNGTPAIFRLFCTKTVLGKYKEPDPLRNHELGIEAANNQPIYSRGANCSVLVGHVSSPRNTSRVQLLAGEGSKQICMIRANLWSSLCANCPNWFYAVECVDTVRQVSNKLVRQS